MPKYTVTAFSEPPTEGQEPDVIEEFDCDSPSAAMLHATRLHGRLFNIRIEGGEKNGK